MKKFTLLLVAFCCLAILSNAQTAFPLQGPVGIGITSFKAVGIGISNPSVKLQVVNGGAGLMGHPYEAAVIESNTDHKFGIYTNVINPLSGGSAVILGYSTYKLRNSFYPGYEMQHGIFADDLNSHFLRFNALESTDAGGVAPGSYRNVMVMDNTGKVGINLGNLEPVPHPSANLHVNGTVRFANLPAGNGAVLVTDAEGNIYRSTLVSGRPANTDNVLTDDVTALKKEVANLRSQVDQLLQLVNQKKSVLIDNSNKSFFIYPNPAKDVIRVSALNRGSVGAKKIVLQNSAGRTLQSLLMDDESINIPLKNIAAGIYLVNIYQNNLLLQSEKVVVK